MSFYYLTCPEGREFDCESIHEFLSGEGAFTKVHRNRVGSYLVFSDSDEGLTLSMDMLKEGRSVGVTSCLRCSPGVVVVSANPMNELDCRLVRYLVDKYGAVATDSEFNSLSLAKFIDP